jgi:hypothetical protein
VNLLEIPTYTSPLLIEECIEWVGARLPSGYGTVYFHNVKMPAHRAMWRWWWGEIPTGQEIMHKCDNRGCVNPYHLCLGTHAENQQDMKRKGRSTIGERNPLAKLKDEQVKEIRFLYATGTVSQYELAERFGVTQTNISMIVNYLTWTRKENV